MVPAQGESAKAQAGAEGAVVKSRTFVGCIRKVATILSTVLHIGADSTFDQIFFRDSSKIFSVERGDTRRLRELVVPADVLAWAPIADVLALAYVTDAIGSCEVVPLAFVAYTHGIHSGIIEILVQRFVGVAVKA